MEESKRVEIGGQEYEICNCNTGGCPHVHHANGITFLPEEQPTPAPTPAGSD